MEKIEIYQSPFPPSIGKMWLNGRELKTLTSSGIWEFIVAEDPANKFPEAPTDGNLYARGSSSWKLIGNSNQVLSDNNFTDQYINSIETNTNSISTINNEITVINSDIEGLREDINNESHFRGYFLTKAQLDAYPNPTPNDYAYLVEIVPPSTTSNKWIYNGTTWVDSGEQVPDQITPATDTTPLMDGTASVGTENKYARGDHRHPTDTTRAADNAVVKLTGDQTSINGIKRFISLIADARTVEDLNSLTDPSTSWFYGAIGNTTLNKPIGVDYFGMQTIRIGGSSIAQLLYAPNSDNEIDSYIRYGTGSAWFSWMKQASIKNVEDLIENHIAIANRLTEAITITNFNTFNPLTDDLTKDMLVGDIKPLYSNSATGRPTWASSFATGFIQKIGTTSNEYYVVVVFPHNGANIASTGMAIGTYWARETGNNFQGWTYNAKASDSGVALSSAKLSGVQVIDNFNTFDPKTMGLELGEIRPFYSFQATGKPSWNSDVCTGYIQYVYSLTNDPYFIYSATPSAPINVESSNRAEGSYYGGTFRGWATYGIGDINGVGLKSKQLTSAVTINNFDTLNPLTQFPNLVAGDIVPIYSNNAIGRPDQAPSTVASGFIELLYTSGTAYQYRVVVMPTSASSIGYPIAIRAYSNINGVLTVGDWKYAAEGSSNGIANAAKVLDNVTPIVNFTTFDPSGLGLAVGDIIPFNSDAAVGKPDWTSSVATGYIQRVAGTYYRYIAFPAAEQASDGVGVAYGWWLTTWRGWSYPAEGNVNGIYPTATSDTNGIMSPDNVTTSVNADGKVKVIGSVPKVQLIDLSQETNGSAWYRIAVTNVNIQNKTNIFKIRGFRSGRHSTTILAVGVDYLLTNSSIVQLSHSIYGTTSDLIKKARLVGHPTAYNGNQVFVEVYVEKPTTASTTTLLVSRDTSGNDFDFDILSTATLGEIPTGYSSKEIDLVAGGMVADSFNGNATSANILTNSLLITDFNNIDYANIGIPIGGSRPFYSNAAANKPNNGSGYVSGMIYRIAEGYYNFVGSGAVINGTRNIQSLKTVLVNSSGVVTNYPWQQVSNGDPTGNALNALQSEKVKSETITNFDTFDPRTLNLLDGESRNINSNNASGAPVFVNAGTTINGNIQRFGDFYILRIYPIIRDGNDSSPAAHRIYYTTSQSWRDWRYDVVSTPNGFAIGATKLSNAVTIDNFSTYNPSVLNLAVGEMKTFTNTFPDTAVGYIIRVDNTRYRYFAFPANDVSYNKPTYGLWNGAWQGWVSFDGSEENLNNGTVINTNRFINGVRTKKVLIQLGALNAGAAKDIPFTTPITKVVAMTAIGKFPTGWYNLPRVSSTGFAYQTTLVIGTDAIRIENSITTGNMTEGQLILEFI